MDLAVISWNVEDLRRVKLDPTAVLARFGEPDVLCLQEVRVRPKDFAQVAALESLFPGYDCHASLAHDPFNARFRGGRVYGVATYVRHGLGARAAPPPPWDHEGRVVSVVFPEHGLGVVNVYAVNGTARPHVDVESGRREGDRHGYKRLFQRRFVEYARALEHSRVRWMFIGDWNMSRSAADTTPRLRTEYPHGLARQEFNDELVPALDVVDVFRARHPSARRYTWFNPRSRYLDAARVDFALVERELLGDVFDAEILDESACFASDHAPIRVRLRSTASEGLPARLASSARERAEVDAVPARRRRA